MKLTRPQKNVLRKIAAGWSLQEHRRRTASKPHFYLFEENERIKVSGKTIEALRKTPFWRCLACEQIPVANCSFALAYHLRLERKQVFADLLKMPPYGLELLKFLGQCSGVQLWIYRVSRKDKLAFNAIGHKGEMLSLDIRQLMSAITNSFVFHYLKGISGSTYVVDKTITLRPSTQDLICELFSNLDA